MATRNPNYRLVKIHRNYTVEETAAVLTVHRNTVRHWIKQGLPTIDTKRPVLILGCALAAFLQARRLKIKRPCRPEEIYCVRCRTPVKPAADMADYEPVTAIVGNLVGMCPRCGSLIYRRINVTRLDQIRGKLDIKMPQGSLRISESTAPSVNCDFGKVGEDHGNA